MRLAKITKGMSIDREEVQGLILGHFSVWRYWGSEVESVKETEDK